jgi:hydrogenase maturation protein HypF
MAKDIAVARSLVDLSPEAQALLISVARPIVLAPARAALAEVGPDNNELGVMLPYTPLQHLLFAAGAPDVLVMTSAKGRAATASRSSRFFSHRSTAVTES